MVKKIKKYLKFMVCCALMLSLVAPSYAALSASDGSAFVTKAEFDSALADFNARLTTFEAGINSKIDSQVTSYLDRNGIWSGKVQILSPSFSDTKAGFTYGPYDATNGLNKVLTTWVSGGNSLRVEEGQMNYPIIPKNDGFENNVLIEKISKGGLMFLYYDLYEKKYKNDIEQADDAVMYFEQGYTDSSGWVSWPEQYGIAANNTYWFSQKVGASLTESLSSFVIGDVKFKQYFSTISKFNLCINLFVEKDCPLYVNKACNNFVQHVLWKGVGTNAVKGSLFWWCDFKKAVVY